ncbi:MAG: hypothetical protein RLZZ591_2817 [Pseudomonadota bacterium]
MVALLYLKHAFNESDEDVIQRWGETPTWQYFSGNEYFEHQWPCAHTQLGQFRKALGEVGVEILLDRTMEVAITLKLIAKKELSRVIVDSTVHEKANWIKLKQTYAKEGHLLGYKAGRYAHAKQFKRMRKTIKRQRTIVGRLQREGSRKMNVLTQAVQATLAHILDKAKRLVAQTASRKALGNRAKLYSCHEPEVECISKGKSRNPYEFGVKVGLAMTLKGNLIVGARSFPGNPYTGTRSTSKLNKPLFRCKTWVSSPRWCMPNWATGAWTKTTRTLRSNTGARTSGSRMKSACCSSDAKRSSPSSGTSRPIIEWGAVTSRDQKVMHCMRCCVPRATTCAGC